MIAMCSCSHEFQDKTYGKGRRVFNMGKTNYRCTVCRATLALSSGEKKEVATTKKSSK